jgi:hypothetical protein
MMEFESKLSKICRKSKFEVRGRRRKKGGGRREIERSKEKKSEEKGGNRIEFN